MTDDRDYRSTMKELDGTDTHKVFAIYDAQRDACWLHFVSRTVPAPSTVTISNEHMQRITHEAEMFAKEWHASTDRAVLSDGTPIMLMLVKERYAQFLIRVDTGERLAAISAPELPDRVREVGNLVNLAESWIARGAAISLHDRLELDTLRSAYTNLMQALERSGFSK